MNPLENDLPTALLIETARRFHDPGLETAAIVELPINPGVSRVNVRRFALERPPEPPVRLVVKPAGLEERLTLEALNGVPGVPYSHSRDLERPGVAPVCMEDAGTELLGFDDAAVQRAAETLAGVHARFLRQGAALPWLPKLDRAHLDHFIVRVCWRPAWERAKADPVFMETFGQWVAPVEASAARLTDDLMELARDETALTLTHTDIYYGHILEHGGRACIIDWGQARYGPLYLDLGDTFDTLEKVEVYQAALEGRGVRLEPGAFGRGHGLGRRFAGVRYVWWWLEAWRSEPQPWKRDGLERMLGLAAGG